MYKAIIEDTIYEIIDLAFEPKPLNRTNSAAISCRNMIAYGEGKSLIKDWELNEHESRTIKSPDIYEGTIKFTPLSSCEMTGAEFGEWEINLPDLSHKKTKGLYFITMTGRGYCYCYADNDEKAVRDIPEFRISSIHL